MSEPTITDLDEQAIAITARIDQLSGRYQELEKVIEEFGDEIVAVVAAVESRFSESEDNVRKRFDELVAEFESTVELVRGKIVGSEEIAVEIQEKLGNLSSLITDSVVPTVDGAAHRFRQATADLTEKAESDWFPQLENEVASLFEAAGEELAGFRDRVEVGTIDLSESRARAEDALRETVEQITQQAQQAVSDVRLEVEQAITNIANAVDDLSGAFKALSELIDAVSGSTRTAGEAVDSAMTAFESIV